MADDYEFIYPYWTDIIPITHGKVEIPWDALEDAGYYPIGPLTAHQLRLMETYGGAKGAMICGRFYESLFNDYIESKSTLEGAPIDGFLESNRTNRGNMDIVHDYRFLVRNRPMPFYPWEMKKMTQSTRTCKYNKQNISTIMALGGGYLVGATVSFAENKVLFRAKYISRDAPP